MKKLGIKSAVVLSSLLALAGCAMSTSTLYPMGKNNYQVVTLSSSEQYANSGSMKKAADVCTQQGKKVAVLKSATTYQGMDKTVAGTLDVAQTLLNKNDDGFPGSSTSRNNDYRNILSFRCV